jgi:hypothetical protein
MVTGIITWIAITCIVVFIQTIILRIAKLQGYNQGTQDEAQQWIDAINKVQVPNWQSLPPGEFNGDPEKAKLAAQIYVAAYKCCLDVIKEEIALNRISAMAEELKQMVLEQEDVPRYPIA